MDPRAVAPALYVTPEVAESSRTAAMEDRSEAAKRRILRRQIGSLERALGEIEAERPGVAPPATPGRRDAGPALLSAGELEQTRTLLVRRLASVQAAIDEQRDSDATPVTKPKAVKRASAKPIESSKVRPATRKRGRSGLRPPGARYAAMPTLWFAA